MPDLDQMIIEMKAANKQRAKTVAISPAQLNTLAHIREQMLNWGGDNQVWKRWEVRLRPGGRLGHFSRGWTP